MSNFSKRRRFTAAMFVVTLTALLAAATTDSQGQTQRLSPPVRTIEACRVGLTPDGRAATFQGTVVYELISNSDGHVQRITTIRAPDLMETLVQLNELRSCLRRWRFGGAGTAYVTLNAGTHGESLIAWKMSVSFGSQSITLVLPRGR